MKLELTETQKEALTKLLCDDSVSNLVAEYDMEGQIADILHILTDGDGRDEIMQATVECATGFTLTKDGIQFDISMPLDEAKAVRKAIDHLTLTDSPLPDDAELELAASAAGQIGDAMCMDLEAVAEEQKQLVISG